MEPWSKIETSLAPPHGNAVPSRPEQLNAEWLTACLRHAGVLSRDARVAGFETARIGEGRGFAGQLARLQLHYEPASAAGPSTLIGKFATDHPPTREMMAWIEAYQREVRFYRELAPELGTSTPHCYFAHFDAAAGCFCLLLEDLAPAGSVDSDAGLSFEQAKFVLEQLAVVHARWWGRVDEIEWLRVSDELVRSVRDRFLASLPGFIERFAGEYRVLVRAATQLGELLAGDELLRVVNSPPMTLAHNDLHPENVFLPSAAGGRFALIDWQSVSASRHGANDVTRILCVGMRPELRRRHGRALLEHYHARLCELGVRGYGLRQLRRRFRQESASMVMVAVLALDTLDFDVSGGQRTIDKMAARIEQALVDIRMPQLLAGMLVFIRVRRWLTRLLRRTRLLAAGER